MQININVVQRKSTGMLRSAGLGIAALALAISNAYAAAPFTQPDIDARGTASAMGVIYAGDTATINGRAFTPGQEIVLSQNGEVISGAAPLVADKDGNFKVDVAIPGSADVGRHVIVLEASKPSTASVFELKVSPKIALSGQDAFTLTSQHMAPGVYQSAYSAKNDRLFVTSAVGRPPVKESQLLKVNPATLAIEARVTPGPDAGRDDGQVQAVYGVAVDDANDTVWVTNTRSNTVAVYKQSDLSLVKQFANGAASHARDVVIDAKNQRAYVSSPGANTISVFDTKSLEALPALELRGKSRAQPSLMSLALDAGQGKLYTISANTNELFIVDLKSGETEHVHALPGARSASGVAVDAKNQQVYVAAQGSDNLLIVDARDGKVLHTVAVGAGALNVAFDPASGLAYVANRGAGTVTLVNGKGQIVANLDGGSYPNHVSVDGKGNAYLLNKAKGKDDATADRISRIQAK